MRPYKPFWDRQKGTLARHGQDPTVGRWLNQSLAGCVLAMYSDPRADKIAAELRALVRDYITGHPT